MFPVVIAVVAALSTVVAQIVGCCVAIVVDVVVAVIRYEYGGGFAPLWDAILRRRLCSLYFKCRAEHGMYRIIVNSSPPLLISISFSTTPGLYMAMLDHSEAGMGGWKVRYSQALQWMSKLACLLQGRLDVACWVPEGAASRGLD